MCHKVKTEILSPTPISERNQVTIAIFSSMCLFLFTPPYPNPTLAPGTCPGTELTETWGLLKKRWIGPTGFFLFLIWIWKYEAIVLAAVGCKVERPRRWGRGWRGGAWHCRFKIKQNEKREGSWWKKSYRKKKGDTRNCLDVFLVADHPYPRQRSIAMKVQGQYRLSKDRAAGICHAVIED